MQKIKKKLSFVFFLFTFSVFAEFNFDLIVQPFTGTEFFVDGKTVKPLVLEKDNTLAKVRLILKDSASAIEVKNKGFRTVNLTDELIRLKNDVGKTADLKAPFSIKALAILSRKESKFDTKAFFPTGRQPKSVTFVNSDTVAVALLDGNGADIINIETGEKKRISPPKEYAEKLGFVEALVLKNKNELWISQMPTALIHVFNLTTFEYKTAVKTSGKWSKVMAYNPLTDRVYLSNWQTFDISVINTETYSEEKKIKTKAVPRGMAFSEDGKFIYCAQFEDAAGNSNCRLVKKELDTFKTVSESGMKGAKRHIVTDYKQGRLYVSDMLNAVIEVYSLKDESLIKTVKVFSHPNTIQLSPDGKFLYVSCRGPNNPDKGYLYKGYVMGRLDIIDTETLTRIESVEAGNQPTGLDISPDGKTIVLSDFLDNRIRVFKKN
ncbi:surface antigen OrfC lipoprotein [Treponema pedis str. T A4]|uniref:Surface antigen OrfC lipoprotein n=2 Tax=Treponema pedis TaxID=409322 RepID=S6A1E4_9SPIR|nr:YncE family protein [Treponema pedis]AGT44603.1 surface antigen OrfC lipoprotein [Treponema pedis str. T A4]